ncbi:hypothetical protein LY78DRAFT_683736 [Colletotrichum sublineola]|uniref:Uncharacterized protein n=1 Tax=Colletotrichum sublineola TaxID=1173701 RepID=A0A066X6A2_COLSU|nr:hypothetical protein LY78DRAFT_683736 [Colletotrichum sublineola]KDN61266.1 hypothetical protein CSUB01_07030 [Colletotrichum sublineola]
MDQPPKVDQSPKSKAELKNDVATAAVQTAKQSCELLSEGLQSMKIREVIEKAKDFSDFLHVVELNDLINDIRTKTNIIRASIQGFQSSALDEHTAKLYEETNQSLDTLMTRIEGLRLCVDEWMESMKRDEQQKKNNTAPET